MEKGEGRRNVLANKKENTARESAYTAQRLGDSAISGVRLFMQACK
jgi:hypothetical protein